MSRSFPVNMLFMSSGEKGLCVGVPTLRPNLLCFRADSSLSQALSGRLRELYSVYMLQNSISPWYLECQNVLESRVPGDQLNMLLFEPDDPCFETSASVGGTARRKTLSPPPREGPAPCTCPRMLAQSSAL